jgi:hypothetical protein
VNPSLAPLGTIWIAWRDVKELPPELTPEMTSRIQRFSRVIASFYSAYMLEQR